MIPRQPGEPPAVGLSRGELKKSWPSIRMRPVAAGQGHRDDGVDRLAAGAMVFADREDPAARQIQLQVRVAQLPALSGVSARRRAWSIR